MIAGKRVSLCMVVYNSVPLLKRAVKTVADVVDEIVIVDQGSDPESSSSMRALLNGYEVQGKQVVYHKTTNKGNADFDRQFCYYLATGDYILALDADEQVPPETLKKIEELLSKYDFDVAWFLFDNFAVHGEKKIDLKEVLGDDAHPRFWKRHVNGESPIFWPAEAHQFPKIASPKQMFVEATFLHSRELADIIRTHLHRGKNIDPRAQGMEKEFVRKVLQMFGFDVQQELSRTIPELRAYLKG